MPCASLLCAGYMALSLGASLPQNTDQDSIEARNAPSPSFALSVGRHVRPWLDLEAETGWYQWQIHGYHEESADGDTTFVPALVTARLHLPGDSWASPFYLSGSLGGGLELVDGSHGSISGRSRSETSAVGAFGLGLGYAARLGRFRAGPDLRYLGTTGHTQLVIAGVRLAYEFTP